jgi:hypothetical protein
MIITDNWTFIHVPRTGGVAFELAYLNTFNLRQGHHYVNSPLERRDFLVNLEIHNEHPMNNWGSEHALVNYWESYIPENSQLFMIVRNPYDRFQSICRRAYDIAPEYLQEKALDIDFVLNHTGYGSWGPAVTQKQYLDSTNKNITVYKFETELSEAYSDHGLEISGVYNQSVNDTDMLTPENIEKINTHFHDDFVEFGYEKR